MFKQSWTCFYYLLISIIYRFGIGFSLSYGAYYTQQNDIIIFVPIGISFILTLYFVINLPFKHLRHNYRSALIHISELIILFIAYYYKNRIKYTYFEYRNNSFEVVIICIAFICLCCIVSIIIVCY